MPGTTPAPDVQQLKRRLGGYIRHGNHDAAEKVRRELKAARVEAFVAEWLADAPRPTPEQVERLRELLPPADRQSRGAAA
ncbi:hypothetical protein [Streptomyces sp. MUM 178J]|uniref:hypothetical protein n=1 Tax=Streptomyces sp. MUM 178J TaxID=2791991 RepID=UPI001F04B897|nr:hypothetical protein [Streptomyces sp. MUM 178J]WRQ80296.1 hypothetical protein I3F59_013565 [Streptomyces sp. MUM 178J]